jgi:predicted lactoylglutathione lyase
MPARKLFVNLPVKDLKRTIDFFTKLGFAFDPRFTDEHATCMILSDEAFVMLLAEARFKDFARRPVSDATKQTEALFAIQVGSRPEVEAMVKTALAAGGKPAAEPQDHGFMYGESFYDLDGHHWEVFWMDASRMPQ